MNSLDILGSLLNGRMGPSAGRLERTVGNQGLGKPGGMFGGGPGGIQGGSQGGAAGSIFDMLGKLAGSMQGGGAPGAGRSKAATITSR